MAARSVMEREREGCFPADKLFAYQLTLVRERKKEKIPSAICSQSEAGVGPGAPCGLGSQTQFQNLRQLPPGLFWEAAQRRGAPAFEAFPVTPELFAHQPKTASSFPGPGWVPVQPTGIVLLPAPAATTPTRVRFLGTEERGRRGQWAPQHPLLGLLGRNHPLHPPRAPPAEDVRPVTSLIPSPVSPQGCPHPSSPEGRRAKGSQQGMTTSKGPGKILGLSGKDLKTAWKGWGG